jgi:hypothetical protein
MKLGNSECQYQQAVVDLFGEEDTGKRSLRIWEKGRASSGSTCFEHISKSRHNRKPHIENHHQHSNKQIVLLENSGRPHEPDFRVYQIFQQCKKKIRTTDVVSSKGAHEAEIRQESVERDSADCA